MMLHILRNDNKWESAELAFFTTKKDIKRLYDELEKAIKDGKIKSYQILNNKNPLY